MEENTAQEIENQQDANARKPAKPPKKRSGKFGLVLLVLMIILMLASTAYVAAVGTNQETIDKAARYDFYKNIIQDYEAKAKICTTPITMFCA